MVVEFFTSLGQVFLAPLEWFVRILESVGATEIYFAVIFIGLVMALLIKPLRGSSGSSKGDD